VRHSFLLYNHTTCVVFQIDFASRDCQIAFFESMEMTGQLRPGDRPEEISSRGIVGGQSFSVDRCVVLFYCALWLRRVTYHSCLIHLVS